MGLKLAKGILYVKLALKRIELCKKIFLIDIDRNEYVYLHGDLSQKQWPVSFQYYDFIINFIDDNFPRDRRDFFKIKNQIASEHHIEAVRSTFLYRFLNIGKNELTQKQFTQQQELMEIDYGNSNHAKCL